MTRYLLKLYVTGQSPRAQIAIDNLRRVCDDVLGDDYELDIIDVLEQPERAEEEKIMATPTLIRVVPPPVRRIIGDLSDHRKVRLGLDLNHMPSRPTEVDHD